MLRDYRWTALLVLTAAVVLVFATLSVLWPVFIEDLDWCIEQYGSHPIVAKCLWYENGLFGRFIQP